ncbi:MAG: PAS domain-containing protein, partial [Pseudolabrys sp.]
MDELVQLSALIGDVYDAALNPTLWIGVLESTARFVGGSAAMIFSKDSTVAQTGQVFYECGIEPEFARSYFAHYITFDPAAHCQLFAKVGDVISMKDFITYEELLETRFYKEWMLPQQMVDAANVIIEKSATSTAMFGVARRAKEGLVDEEMRHRMRLLTPHFRRAVLIGRLLDHTKSQAAELADTLEGLSAGVFIVDANGRIIHANTAGRALLSSGALAAIGERLSARNPAIDKVLYDSVVASSRGDGAITDKGISVPIAAADGENYVAHVLPLTSGERRRVCSQYAAVAAVFAYKAKLSSVSPLEV